MKGLTKINNEWVKIPERGNLVIDSDFLWLKERSERFKEEEEIVKVTEEVEAGIEGCKSYNDIVKAFRGDEPRPEVYKLPREWQDKVALGENLKELRSLLGWTLYQEWIKETITE